MWIYHEENNGSDPQETGCQVRDFISWCFYTATLRSWYVFGKSRSCVSVSRRSRDVFLERLVSSRSWRLNVSVSSRSCDLTSCGHPCPRPETETLYLQDRDVRDVQDRDEGAVKECLFGVPIRSVSIKHESTISTYTAQAKVQARLNGHAWLDRGHKRNGSLISH